MALSMMGFDVLPLHHLDRELAEAQQCMWAVDQLLPDDQGTKRT
jgi:hypothetical protein